MRHRRATVTSHLAEGRSAAPGAPSHVPSDAERIRRDLAAAWGTVGAAWGVPPATARVHGYLMAQRTPLAEREIRAALGLSHRATSMALVESEAWGLIERVPAPRRAGRRGPEPTAYQGIGDHWRWFGRVVEQRRLREGDPAVAAIERASADATTASRRSPGDAELDGLRDWLADFLSFVRLFDRAAALVAGVPARQTERAMRLLGQLPDDTVRRLVALIDAVPDADFLPLLDAVSRLSPHAAARTTRLVAGVVRRAGR